MPPQMLVWCNHTFPGWGRNGCSNGPVMDGNGYVPTSCRLLEICMSLIPYLRLRLNGEPILSHHKLEIQAHQVVVRMAHIAFKA